MKPEVIKKHEALFMDWLSARHPRLKQYIVAKHSGADADLGAFSLDSITSTINSVLGSATNALKSYVNGKNELDLVKVNWDRAQKGLPPFNTVAEAQAAAKGNGISTSGILGAGGALLKSPFFWVAVGLGAFLLIRGRRK